MAFLLRLRSTLSLLHHHSRLIFTSNSGELLFTWTTPSLLHHHHRLFSTSNPDDPNSNNPSPSLLRELREAIKQISSSLPKCDPTSSTFPSPPSFNSKEEDADQNVPTIDTKLHQLKLSVLSLRQKQLNDHKRFCDMDHSRIAFGIEIKKNFVEFFRQLDEQPHMQTPERLRNDTDTFITRLTRGKEMTMELVQVAEVLTKSRLASLEEIIENLSQLRNDLQQEVFDELNEGMMKGKEMELKQFELVAQEINGRLAALEKIINYLFEIHCGRAHWW